MTDGESKRIVKIYTDGACHGNPGPGGWGAVLQYDVHEREICGGEAAQTTNNRMELMAPIRALEILKRPSTVCMYTDSMYVRDGITKWLPQWKANGWQTRGKKPVKNSDLWQRLDIATKPHTIEWCWVKGHAGHPENERADRLAAQGMKKAVDTGQCIHELLIGSCDICKAPPYGILAHGYRTKGGNAYHNDRNCLWMHKGQQKARRSGKDVHDVVSVAWTSITPGTIEACEFCCTPEWLRHHS